MLTREQNPPIQSPEEAKIGQFEGRWWVAYCKSRQEKALAWDILRSGGQYFLPMYEAIRRSRGRKWKTWLPLFPGYVFLCGDEDDRLGALTTNRIANVIPVRDQPRLIRELRAVRQLLDSPEAIDPHPKLTQGARCRICRGPLTGLEGVVERRKDRLRFVVAVSILGQGASAEVDAEALEARE